MDMRVTAAEEEEGEEQWGEEEGGMRWSGEGGE